MVHTRDLVTGIPAGVKVRIAPNEKIFGKYDMSLLMKADGVKCVLCGDEIVTNVYYCEQDNTFMHKQCLIKGHKICDNASIIDIHNTKESMFHEDKSVDVRFIEED